MGRGRLRWLVVGGIALVALVGGRALVLRDTATPVTVGEAVARFRAQAVAADLPIPPGVYVYATTGKESISALGGMTHEYPVTSTITVAGGGCGVTMRWDVLRSRWNEYEVCEDGRRLEAWRESHRFVGRDDRSTWACTDTGWLPTNVAAEAESTYRCESADTLQLGTTTVVGLEQLVVGGDEVETVRVTIAADESGEARGSLFEERWLEAETGLPVRITYRVRTLNDSPIGDVVFEERYTLFLTSLEPRR